MNGASKRARDRRRHDPGGQPIHERLLLRPEEAADQLAVSRTTLYALLATGELESLRIGRSRRIATGDLIAYVERRSPASRLAMRSDAARSRPRRAVGRTHEIDR
jgi:excisionase family DNA binding protein